MGDAGADFGLGPGQGFWPRGRAGAMAVAPVGDGTGSARGGIAGSRVAAGVAPQLAQSTGNGNGKSGGGGGGGAALGSAPVGGSGGVIGGGGTLGGGGGGRPLAQMTAAQLAGLQHRPQMLGVGADGGSGAGSAAGVGAMAGGLAGVPLGNRAAPPAAHAHALPPWARPPSSAAAAAASAAANGSNGGSAFGARGVIGVAELAALGRREAREHQRRVSAAAAPHHNFTAAGAAEAAGVASGRARQGRGGRGRGGHARVGVSALDTRRPLGSAQAQASAALGAGSGGSGGGAQVVTLASSALAAAAALGKECVRLTNVFRAQHALPPLEWHGTLAAVGFGHSRDMGLGKAPFDHVGFAGRVRRYPFRARAAAENLAMMSGVGVAAMAQTAVQGWVESPGHRKNLLCRATWCGVGVFKNRAGTVYFTQLFGLQ